MTNEERIIKNLVAYRAVNNLTQDQMAALIGIGLRTYQKIETTGKVSKTETLNGIIQKTALPGTQKNAGYVSEAGEEIDKLKESVLSLQAAIDVLLVTISGVLKVDSKKELSLILSELHHSIDLRRDKLKKKILKEQEQK